MSEPIGQHIVPQCYLKNFAVEKRAKEAFVDVMFKKNSGKIHRQNIRNICKIREFYTFDNLPDKEKRWLEKYYSNNVESLYHEVYKALTDASIEKITSDLKLKIIVYIISQELRTPKISDALNSVMNRVLEHVFLAHEQLGTEKKVFSEKGEVVDLEGTTLEEAKKESNNSNRQMANLESVKRLKHIVELKSNYHIMVVKYEGKIGLISSDRPVHCSESLYSPDCKISLPIDRNHIVNLYPYDEEIESDSNKILRLNHDEHVSYLCVLSLNALQIDKAEHFIYGKKDDIVCGVSQYDRLMSQNQQTF